MSLKINHSERFFFVPNPPSFGNHGRPTTAMSGLWVSRKNDFHWINCCASALCMLCNGYGGWGTWIKRALQGSIYIPTPGRQLPGNEDVRRSLSVATAGAWELQGHAFPQTSVDRGGVLPDVCTLRRGLHLVGIYSKPQINHTATNFASASPPPRPTASRVCFLSGEGLFFTPIALVKCCSFRRRLPLC